MKIVHPRVSAQAAALIARAESETGLTDWGPSPFREGLERLLAAVASEPGVSAATLESCLRGLARRLDKRLRLFADRSRHPEIARQRIRRPLVVVGLPRTGTTILHALLAQDPAARAPLTWEVGAPSPPPLAAEFKSDARIATARAAIERMPAELKKKHMLGPEVPEECIALSNLSFQDFAAWATYRIPDYRDWLLETDSSPAYAIHEHFLQHLQAFTAREWWVLKSPLHLIALEQLFKSYQDARVIWTHRDPAHALPSLASLIAELRAGVGIGTNDVGAECVAFWRRAMDRALAFRSRGEHAEQFVDVQYGALTRDPIAVVKRIYAHFGTALSSEAEEAMRAFLIENPQGKHGQHRYSAQSFGLDAGSLRKSFQDYIDAYDVDIH